MSDVKILTDEELLATKQIASAGVACKDRGRWPHEDVLRLLATIDSLRAERRTPGTDEVCARCGVDRSMEVGGWSSCFDRNCKVNAIRQPQEAK